MSVSMQRAIAAFELALGSMHPDYALTLQAGRSARPAGAIGLPAEYWELVAWRDGQSTCLGDHGIFAHGSFVPCARALALRGQLLQIAQEVIAAPADRDAWFHHALLPVAEDAGGDCLCLDAGSGHLVQHIHDGTLEEAGYASLAELLEAHTAALQLGSVGSDGLHLGWTASLWRFPSG